MITCMLEHRSLMILSIHYIWAGRRSRTYYWSLLGQSHVLQGAWCSLETAVSWLHAIWSKMLLDKLYMHFNHKLHNFNSNYSTVVGYEYFLLKWSRL